MPTLINSPKGAAFEYSTYAMSFHEGCTEAELQCEYCFMRKMSKRFKSYFGPARLKPWLINEENALVQFKKEVKSRLLNLQKNGLFFNFSSDPCLRSTIDLNIEAWKFLIANNIPIKILTKQGWWALENYENILSFPKHLIAFGWTLSGRDDKEPGADPNDTRILAARKVHDLGFKTFASIEPIISFHSSAKMIGETRGFIDLYKIGLESGKKYDVTEARAFFHDVNSFLYRDAKIYWKDSLLNLIGEARCDLPDNCVTRDFNIWKGI